MKEDFNIVYQEQFFKVLKKVVKSNKQVKVINWIANQFTYKQTEVNLSYKNCTVNISKPHFMKILRTLVKNGYLMKVSRGIYRINPFMYVPYKADVFKLQEEWSELEEQNKIKDFKKKLYK